METYHGKIAYTGIEERYRQYDNIIGKIYWVLIAIVSFDLYLIDISTDNAVFIGILLVVMFIYNLNRYGIFIKKSGSTIESKKLVTDIIVLLAFTVVLCWFTGTITSPFFALMYFVLLTAALTQGRRVTLFIAALVVISFMALAYTGLHGLDGIVSMIVKSLPFMIIAHLGAMLTGENESARCEVERLSHTDNVTGFNNMENFHVLAGVQERIAKRHKRTFSVCIIDLDNLKQINDHYGHFAGTSLIQQVAQIMRKNIRSSDICARYGGDEFAIMFIEGNKQNVVKVLERMIADMAGAAIMLEGGRLIGTTLSVGLAGFPEDGDDMRSIVAHADIALTASKMSGKNRLTVYDGSMGHC